MHGFTAVRCDGDSMAKLAQSLTQWKANIGLIVYEQDVEHADLCSPLARWDVEARILGKQARFHQTFDKPAPGRVSVGRWSS
jgi:hypothetical protein